MAYVETGTYRVEKRMKNSTKDAQDILTLSVATPPCKGPHPAWLGEFAVLQGGACRGCQGAAK